MSGKTLISMLGICHIHIPASKNTRDLLFQSELSMLYRDGLRIIDNEPVPTGKLVRPSGRIRTVYEDAVTTGRVVGWT